MVARNNPRRRLLVVRKLDGRFAVAMQGEDPNEGAKAMRTWTVKFGQSKVIYYTAYHAEQFAEALRRNGTRFTVEGPDRSKNNAAKS